MLRKALNTEQQNKLKPEITDTTHIHANNIQTVNNIYKYHHWLDNMETITRKMVRKNANPTKIMIQNTPPIQRNRKSAIYNSKTQQLKTVISFYQYKGVNTGMLTGHSTKSNYSILSH